MHHSNAGNVAPVNGEQAAHDVNHRDLQKTNRVNIPALRSTMAMRLLLYG